MKDFCVVKLLEGGGLYGVESCAFRDVEIRPSSYDLEEEVEALKSSIEKNGYAADPKFTNRICTIVCAPDRETAIRFADERFFEVLDVWDADAPLSKMELSECGFVKNLVTAEILPIERQIVPFTTAFMCAKGPYKALEFNHWVLRQTSALALRYRRSLHWSKKARGEKNLQLAILFKWFSVEALFKETKTDSVGPYIRWFLGYPCGPYASGVSKKLLQQLEAKPEYDKWRKWIEVSIEEIREMRNDSVHSGFRSIDFSVDDIVKYNGLMTYGCSRCQGAVRKAIGNGLQTVAEFKEYVGVIFETTENLVNDVHGNILYTLEYSGFRCW